MYFVDPDSLRSPKAISLTKDISSLDKLATDILYIYKEYSSCTTLELLSLLHFLFSVILNTAVTATGVIWSRYSTVITPVS